MPHLMGNACVTAGFVQCVFTNRINYGAIDNPHSRIFVFLEHLAWGGSSEEDFGAGYVINVAISFSIVFLRQNS